MMFVPLDERKSVVVGARGSWWRFSLATRLRCAIALLSLGVAVVEGHVVHVLPWVALVIALEIAGERRRSARAAKGVLYGLATVVALALFFILDDTVAVLPLLLVPAYRASEQHGRAEAASIPLLLGAGAAFAAWWHRDDVTLIAVVQWWALAVGLAQLGAWGRRIESDRTRPDVSAAREAGVLLGRLQDLARQLPTGLDVPAVATMLLDEVTGRACPDRAAVLVRVADDRVSPVALTGVERIPWRDPVRSAGTMHEAWTKQKVVQDLRAPDAQGRRKGSVMLAVPLADRDDELLGLLVLERLSPVPFSHEDVAFTADAATRLGPHLHAALAFAELRHVSEVAERERLAREMHDGVAQDLSALGFALDAATKRVALVDSVCADRLREVRAELNRTIRDIRLSISDLRSSIRPERGLGAAISSHVQSMGSAGDIAVTVALQESPFRLPSHHESVLLRLVQDFLGDARTRRTATSLTVELETHPPQARMRLERDGGGGWEPDEVLVSALQSLGGKIEMTPVDDVVVVATVELGGSRPGSTNGVAPEHHAVPLPHAKWAAWPSSVAT